MGDASGLLWIVAVILVIAGMAGTVLPALPGTPLVFLGLLVAAWADGFQKVGWFTLVLLGILTVASLVIDFLATSMGAKRVGASMLAVVGAAIGTIVGIFLGIPGLILGPFIGAVLGEYIARRDLRQAGKVGLGTWLGLVLGSAAKLALTFLMIGLFVAAYYL
jgi:uncharacterized protein YqgC (DUF456 family)